MPVATDPARVVAAVQRAKRRNEVRKAVSPAVAQYQEMVFGHNVGPALPRDPMQFLAGTFTPLTPIQPVPVNVPDWEDDDGNRPGPRQREMPVGWNMPVGVPGSEGFKLASFGTLRMYADIYSVARACIQLRKNEIRGLEWDVMPTVEAERKMRGDVAAHREFAERRAKVVKFFRKPDPDYLSFGSYVDAVIEEMLVTDALSLYIHPTKKKGAGPFGSDVAALEIISGSTIRPLVNTRGGRVRPPSPGYQQYLYGVPRVDLMEILQGKEDEQLKDLGKPDKEYRGDQLMYVPYTQRSWTPYGFPPLERTLIPTITGLRKQQFQMDFFDEGTIPGNYISPGETLGWTPNQLQIWQNQNNAIAGDPAWKHKSVALPPGSKVFPMKPIPIADQSDEVIMSQVCMGYDVEPMELGVSPKVSATQSAGAANQMAKASQDKQQRKSTKPTLSFITDIFNVLIQVIWDQEDMRFVFEGLEENEDENALVDKLVQLIQYGLSSIDEARIALGKSPWGLPITSDPVYVSPTAGMVPLGSIDPTSGKPMGTPPPAAVGAPPPPGAAGPGSPPPGVGGAPGGPPKALPPGAAPKPGQPPAGSPGAAPAPSGAKPGQPPAPVGPTDAFGKPLKPGDPGTDDQHPGPPPKLHPDDKVGQARQGAAEAHAGVQQQMHEDFASGKPLEPPVRPPVQSEDTVQPKGPQTKAMLSELDALRRKTKAAGRPLDWDCKHLDIYYVTHFYDLCKVLTPDDAHRVVKQEVIAAFGPPTLQAELEKVFDQATPIDSQNGKQGLAPMEYQGEKPVEQSYPRCAGCGKRHKPPACQTDNGATADNGPNGATKTVVLPKARGTTTTAYKVGPHGYSHGWVFHGVPGTTFKSPITQKYRVPGKYSDASKRYAGLAESDPKVRATTLWSSSFGDMVAMKHVMNNLMMGEHPFADDFSGNTLDSKVADRFEDVTNSKGDKVLFDKGDWANELASSAHVMNQMIEHDSRPVDDLYRGMDADPSKFRTGDILGDHGMSWSGSKDAAKRYATGDWVYGGAKVQHGSVVIHGSGVPAVHLAPHNKGPNQSDDEYVSSGDYIITGTSTDASGVTHVEVQPYGQG